VFEELRRHVKERDPFELYESYKTLQKKLESNHVAEVAEGLKHLEKQISLDTLKREVLYACGDEWSLVRDEIATLKAKMEELRLAHGRLVDKRGLKVYKNWCNRLYLAIQKFDELISEWLQCNTSIKSTTEKPSGTVSLLAGATSGIHHEHAPAYYRTKRMASDSSLLKPLRDAGYRIEKLICYTEDGTRYESEDFVVVYFPVIAASYIKRTKSDVTLEEQFKLATACQKYWSDNQVSMTMTFNPKTETEHIKPLIMKYRNKLKSGTLLRYEEGVYEQAPLQAAPVDEIRAYKESLKERNWDSIEPTTPAQQIVNVDLNTGCDGDRCVMPSKNKQQQQFV
jgi:hypothetical protein